MPTAQRAKKSKRPNDSPARARYWNSGRLRKRKIAHLMKYNGMTRADAATLWDSSRKGRRK